MTPRAGVAVGLVVLLAGCGDSTSPTQDSPTTKRAAKAICGYPADSGIPADVAEVLPGQPALLGDASDAQVEALVDLPFKAGYDAIVKRAQQNGWTLQDHERESADAEMELTKGDQRLSLSLSPSGISGCTATHVAVVSDAD